MSPAMYTHIRDLIRVLISKPLGYWFGATESVDYEVKAGWILQSTRNQKRELFALTDVRSWKRLERAKSVLVRLGNNRSQLIKDSTNRLTILLDEVMPERREDRNQ